jgi:hypothetical protein
MALHQLVASDNVQFRQQAGRRFSQVYKEIADVRGHTQNIAGFADELKSIWLTWNKQMLAAPLSLDIEVTNSDSFTAPTEVVQRYVHRVSFSVGTMLFQAYSGHMLAALSECSNMPQLSHVMPLPLLTPGCNWPVGLHRYSSVDMTMTTTNRDIPTKAMHAADKQLRHEFENEVIDATGLVRNVVGIIAQYVSNEPDMKTNMLRDETPLLRQVHRRASLPFKAEIMGTMVDPRFNSNGVELEEKHHFPFIQYHQEEVYTISHQDVHSGSATVNLRFSLPVVRIVFFVVKDGLIAPLGKQFHIEETTLAYNGHNVHFDSLPAMHTVYRDKLEHGWRIPTHSEVHSISYCDVSQGNSAWAYGNLNASRIDDITLTMKLGSNVSMNDTIKVVACNVNTLMMASNVAAVRFVN